jgi:hypothetical protein
MNEEKPVQAQKPVQVYGQSDQLAYSRTISMREVTFVCIVCQQETTQLRYPGKLPLYCSDLCREKRAEEQNKERVRKQREKRQKQRAAVRKPAG